MNMTGSSTLKKTTSRRRSIMRLSLTDWATTMFAFISP
jgi:hypothetical protein